MLRRAPDGRLMAVESKAVTKDRNGRVDKKDKKLKKIKRKAVEKQLAEAVGKIKVLEEQLSRERAWHVRYHDALEEAGLICGVCLEEPVLQSNLKCCSNKLCSTCEDQIAEKHEACPFCRAFLTTPKLQERKRQEELLLQQQQQQQQQQQRQLASSSRPRTRRRSYEPRARYGDDDSSNDSDSYHDGDSEDASEDYSEEYNSDAPAGGMDTSVLLAAAAEAAVAAVAGPKDSCGLCGSQWLVSSLAKADALPDLLICRSCWRNVPELANQQFPQDGAAAAAPGMAARCLQLDMGLMHPAADGRGSSAANMRASSHDARVAGSSRNFSASLMAAFRASARAPVEADVPGAAGPAAPEVARRSHAWRRAAAGAEVRSSAAAAAVPTKKRKGASGSNAVKKARTTAAAAAAAAVPVAAPAASHKARSGHSTGSGSSRKVVKLASHRGASSKPSRSTGSRQELRGKVRKPSKPQAAAAVNGLAAA